MATATDLSGNNPMGGFYLDKARITGSMVPVKHFRGALQTITLSGTSQQSSPFGQFCTMIRLSVEGSCHYAVGVSPTAVKDGSEFLAAGNVEIIPVTAGQRIALIQDAAETNVVEIKEDR